MMALIPLPQDLNGLIIRFVRFVPYELNCILDDPENKIWGRSWLTLSGSFKLSAVPQKDFDFLKIMIAGLSVISGLGIHLVHLWACLRILKNTSILLCNRQSALSHIGTLLTFCQHLVKKYFLRRPVSLCWCLWMSFAGFLVIIVQFVPKQLCVFYRTFSPANLFHILSHSVHKVSRQPKDARMPFERHLQAFGTLRLFDLWAYGRALSGR